MAARPILQATKLTFAASDSLKATTIPAQTTENDEFHVVGVVNELAEGVTVTCVTVLTDAEDTDHDLVHADFSVPSGGKVTQPVVGWLIGESELHVSVSGGSSAGGDVHVWVIENA